MAGDINLSANFNTQVKRPIDDRLQVADITERNSLGLTQRYLYMEVTTIDDGSKYLLINDPGTETTTNSDWVLAGGTSGSVNFGLQGEIPFVNATNDNFDYSSDIFWDNVNSRLGINTNIPNYAIDTGINRLSSNIRTIELRLSADNGNNTARIYGEGFGDRQLTYQAGRHVWQTQATQTEAMRIHENTRNLSIGSSVDNGYKLEVFDSGQASFDALRLSSGGRAFLDIQRRFDLNFGGAIRRTNTSNTIGWAIGHLSQSLDTFNFYSNSSEILTLKSNGNVGIGTTTPQEKLHVSGKVLIEELQGGTVQDILKIDADFGTLVSIGKSTSTFGPSNRTDHTHTFRGGEFNVTSDVGNVSRFFVSSGGNVLVGSTTDNGSKLQVEGTTTTNKLAINTNSAGVFDVLMNGGVHSIQNNGRLEIIQSNNDQAFRVLDSMGTIKFRIDTGASTGGSLVEINGSVSKIVTTTTTNLTLDETNYNLICDATDGDITITLPSAVGIPGREYIVLKKDSSTNIVTIQANGVETINGQNTRQLQSQYDKIKVVSDGSERFILSQY